VAITAVRLRAAYVNLNAGECCGLEESEAQRLVDAGLAELLAPPPAVPADHQPAAAEPTPKPSRKGRK
jgi:hypothetical protein